MNKKIDNLLLGVLWLIAATLITCFWFNTIYGFNIFYGAHWDYLARTQATNATIKPSFYLSMIACTTIAISGLYILIRPKFRHIKLRKHIEKPHIKTTNITTTQQTTNVQSPAPTIDMGLTRPARLNIPGNLSQSDNTIPVAPIAPISTATQLTSPAPKKDYPELREMFESAGYVIKPAPKISGIQTDLLAIGTNETVFIGGVNISTADLEKAIKTMQQVFFDTLDDIEITIVGFVVEPTEITETKHIPEILTFDTFDELREYVSEHPNEEPDDDMRENFEAFSTYISTVIDYIGKL